MNVTSAWTNDGWHAYYIDGKLRFEGHSIPEDLLFKLLEIPYESVHINERWIEETGFVTQDLEDLPLEE